MKELRETPYSDILRLYEGIKRVKAREDLRKLNLMDYTHCKAKDRKEIWKKVEQEAYPDAKKSDYITMDQIAGMLKNGK